MLKLNLLTILFDLINPSLYKTISKVNTLIIAAKELPIAMPTCP
jgi:hypothetical protein